VDAREKSAISIQKAWRSTMRKMDLKSQVREIITNIKSLGGSLIKNEEELENAQKNGDIVVQLDVMDEKALSFGHSAIYMGDNCYELQVSEKKNSNALASSKYTAIKISKHPQTNNPLSEKKLEELKSFENLYINLYESAQWKTDGTRGKLKNLSKRGVLFKVPKEYSTLLKEGIKSEVEIFKNTPLGFGRQYNCTTFVRNCFRRLFVVDYQQKRKMIEEDKLNQKTQKSLQKQDSTSPQLEKSDVLNNENKKDQNFKENIQKNKNPEIETKRYDRSGSDINTNLSDKDKKETNKNNSSVTSKYGFFSGKNLATAILEIFERIGRTFSQITPVIPFFLFDNSNTLREDKNYKPKK